MTVITNAELILKDSKGNIGTVKSFTGNDINKISNAITDISKLVDPVSHLPIKATATAVGVVQLADAEAIAAGTTGRVVDAKQLQDAVNGVSPANCVTNVAAGSTANKIKVTKDGYTTTIVIDNVEHAGTATSANSVAWNNVSGKPSTFTPSSHTHDYLPLAGGNVTGNLTVQNKNVVRSVNGVNADAKGNTDVNKLKDINLGDFIGNQEVTTLDTTEGNCVLVGAAGKSHNYDMEGTDWAFIQVHSSTPYQKFQLGTSVDNELMYRTSDIDDTSWEDWSKVSLIAEHGSNYIRYHNGIQICWGSLSFTSSSHGWGNLYESMEVHENYPKSFKSVPAVTSGSSGEHYCFVESGSGTNVITPKFQALRPVAFTDNNFRINYIAIGLWK